MLYFLFAFFSSSSLACHTYTHTHIHPPSFLLCLFPSLLLSILLCLALFVPFYYKVRAVVLPKANGAEEDE